MSAINEIILREDAEDTLMRIKKEQRANKRMKEARGKTLLFYI